ncbi:MAG: hypothetical protein HKP52_09375 [Desulfofustis sp.]|nr:hypothetical protein [Desulfofustis sp.]
MEEFDDDPLDLLEDDGDGVIETILLEEEEEKPIQERVGCSLIIAAGGSATAIGWGIASYFA